MSVRGQRAAGVPHDHSTYVEGCFRCELSRDEVEDVGCVDCPNCEGGGVGEDGHACFDCAGTGCERHPFCDADHDEEDIPYA